MRFTAIDFETANSYRSSICAVGLAIVEDGQIVERHHQLIRPEPLYFDPFNVMVHGITESDVADAPLFDKYWPRLRTLMHGPLVAHNASFDISVLRHSLDQYGIAYPAINYYCTLVIARLAWPGQPSYSLDHVADTLAISFHHHDASEDAFACAHVALAACHNFDVDDLHELPYRCALTVGQLFEGGYSPCCGPRSVSRHVRAVDITPTSTVCNPDHPFFGKSFIFTGTLASMVREDAMRAVVNCGGICHESVKKETDYLVLGQQGYIGYRAGHKSSKMKRAESLRSAGYPIEILAESDFIRML